MEYLPKVKPLTEKEKKDSAFIKELAGEMKVSGVTCEQLAVSLGISLNTLYRKRKNPETFELRELRILKDMFPGMNIL